MQISAALPRYAELADVSEGVARQLRDEFFPKLRRAFSRRQITSLVQIAAAARAG